MLKKRAFTLLEMMLVIIASGTLISVIFSVLTTLPKVKVYNDARQTLIQQTNDIMNRFSVLFQDYTIDYEEYFNRQMVGCDSKSSKLKQGTNFERNITGSGHCDAFTAYGNENSRRMGDWADWQAKHWIKYCSSKNTYYESKDNCQKGDLQQKWRQSYGQYKALFRDIGDDTDGQNKANVWGSFPAVWDADDEDLGTWTEAIRDANNVKELYLISHDKSRRLLIRKDKKNWHETLQILKLRAFDAGDSHSFDTNNNTVFDWHIDTRACDAGEGFFCKGDTNLNNWDQLEKLYPKYKLPQDIDDWRVDLFPESINVRDFTLAITPTKDPNYAWNEDKQQINPYIKITISTQLNPNIREKKLGNMLKDYTFTLQSSFDTRWFYIQ